MAIKLKLHIRLAPAVIAVILFVSAMLLGNWQLTRAQYKTNLQNEFSQMTMRPTIKPQECLEVNSCIYRKVYVHGEYLPQYTIYLDNKIHKGRAGYHVLTPMKIPSINRYILINRGWIAKTFASKVNPNVPTPAGLREVEGIAVTPSTKFLQLSKINVEEKIWQNLNIEQYSQLTKLPVLPIVLEQISDSQDNLIRDWQQPDFGITKHQGYAFQWFSLAALVAVIYFYFAISLKQI